MTAPDPRLEEIEGRLSKATPGPWGEWFGNTDSKSIQLATKDRGRQFIMTFWRWGMQGAQPWFNTNMMMGPASDLARYQVCPDAQSRDDKRVYRADISGINHPDAEFIAAAPADVAYLLAELRKAQDKLARVEGLHKTKFYDKWGKSVDGDEGYGGWCSECLRFAGPACPTIAAVADATGGERG